MQGHRQQREQQSRRAIEGNLQSRLGLKSVEHNESTDLFLLHQKGEAKSKKEIFIVTSLELVAVAWFRITYTHKAYNVFQKLPQNALLFVYGAIFCFFGGTFPTLFAAIQAAKYGGQKTVVDAILDLSDKAMIIIKESKKDDTKDEIKMGRKTLNRSQTRNT